LLVAGRAVANGGEQDEPRYNNFIFMVPCVITLLIRSNKMQQYAIIYLPQNHYIFWVSITSVIRNA